MQKIIVVSSESKSVNLDGGRKDSVLRMFAGVEMFSFYVQYSKNTNGGGRNHELSFQVPLSEVPNMIAEMEKSLEDVAVRRAEHEMNELHAKANIINDTLYS